MGHSNVELLLKEIAVREFWKTVVSLQKHKLEAIAKRTILMNDGEKESSTYGIFPTHIQELALNSGNTCDYISTSISRHECGKELANGYCASHTESRTKTQYAIQPSIGAKEGNSQKTADPREEILDTIISLREEDFDITLVRLYELQAYFKRACYLRISTQIHRIYISFTQNTQSFYQKVQKQIQNIYRLAVKLNPLRK
ncbi:hypothetical protein RCL_jg22459.t1 [Rhizophagus clarus]|uniref:Uncharacterized protein n=1 Tax=Rhizophagus clarus TaxID=94130 RepID=A0A8H3R5B8_9GLOM|nr:hypothetical protein RCL_jg22459.t1 [Rhizophagus clarus]